MTLSSAAMVIPYVTATAQEHMYLPHELQYEQKELPPVVYSKSSSKSAIDSVSSHLFHVGFMFGPTMRGHQRNSNLPIKYSSIGCFFKFLAGINHTYKNLHVGAELYVQSDVGESRVDQDDAADPSVYHRYVTIGIMPKIGYYANSKTLCFLGLGLEGSYDYFEGGKKLINFYLAPSVGIDWSISKKINLRLAYQFSWTPSKRSFGFDSNIGKIRSLSHSIGLGFILKI